MAAVVEGGWLTSMARLPRKDVAHVRRLGEQVRELAESDEYQRRRERWRAANERRRGDRAPVWCRVARAWREVLPQDSLVCEDPYCRTLEYALRQRLYKNSIGDDEIFPPWWEVDAVWDCAVPHVWGLAAPQVESTEAGGFRYEHPLEQVEDYERLRVPSFSYNARKTDEALGRAADLLGDALPVRLRCFPPLNPMQAYYLERLRGMEALLEDLAFRPQVVHRAMAKLTEGILQATRVAEETGLLTTNHHEPMFCSDPVNEPSSEGPVRLHNLWTAVNSQEFEVVSPAMQEEFLVNYQLPVLQQYGAVQYGCCEDLTRKVDLVLKIPNLRIFVSSAWTDLETVVAKCGADYTIMWRQAAADVTLPDDLSTWRRCYEEGLRKLQGCHYQVVLRELETLNGRLDRLREWARLAIDLAEKHAR